MDILIPIMVCILCWASGVLVSRTTNSKYLNSKVYYPTTCGIKPVKFKVIKIEKALDTEGNLIAKYTVAVYFFAKENDKDWKYNKFCIYDNVDKYKIGDVLTFNKIN